MKSIFKAFLLLVMNNRGSIGALGGEAPPAEGTPPEGGTPPIEGDPSAEQSLYGELKVKWPEGIDEGLKGEASLKSFVDSEGNINFSNLAKSFVHTKKQTGMDKVVLPSETSSVDEINEFYEKLGFKSNKEEYTIDKIEESRLDDGFMASLKDFAHENHIPVATANKMAAFLNDQTIEGEKDFNTAQTENIRAGLDSVKEEFGQAFDQKLNVAKRVLTEVVKDEAILKSFDDPMIGSNPAVIKALVAIGESLYSEDSFKGNQQTGLYSPEEASEKINSIMGDKTHPYHNREHSSHQDAVKKMMKLFEMKN